MSEREQRCYNDKHVILPGTTQRYQYPEAIDEKGQFIWNLALFCSIPCVRFYLRQFKSHRPDLIVMFELYLQRDLGVNNMETALDPIHLACFNVDQKGLNIQEYRNLIQV